MDVDGLVVHLFQRQIGARQRPLSQLLGGALEPVHDIQHVDADFPVGVDGHGAFAPGDDETLSVHHALFDYRHVAQSYRLAVAPVEHHVAELLRVVRAGEAQGVTAFADVGFATGDVLVATSAACRFRQLDAQHCRPVGVESNPHFALAPATNLGPGDTGHALEACLHDLLHVVLVALDIARVAVGGLENEPGDGAAAPAHGADHRLVGVVRITGDAIQAIENFQQTTIEIMTDLELDADLALAPARLGEHLGHPRQSPQYLLLGLDDLRFHLFRRRRAPAGADGDLGLLDLRGQLYGQSRETQGAEQHHQQHRYRCRHGVAQRQPRPAHGKSTVSMMVTLCPGRRRSPPRTTTRSPDWMPSTWMSGPTAMPVVTDTRCARPSASMR